MRNRNHFDRLLLAAGQKTKERDYWLNRFSGEFEKTGFPYDFRQARGGEMGSGSLEERLPGELSVAAIDLSAGSDVRLHMILLAAATLLVYKYTGRSDITIGVPILRPDVEAEFINTVLAQRNRVGEEMSFKEFLLEVRKTSKEANENQGYPIEVLVEKLGLPSREESFPLFDLAVLLENIHDPKHLEAVSPPMIFSFKRQGEEILLGVRYHRGLYQADAVRRIIGHFQCLLKNLLSNIEMKVSKAGILTAEEKEDILQRFNRPGRYAAGETIQGLFAREVEKNGDGIALVGRRLGGLESGALTYRQLDREAETVCLALAERGVGAGTVVGIMMGRSIELIVGLLGILKAGAAYLPINPKTPEERVQYMLADSGAEIVFGPQGVGANCCSPIQDIGVQCKGERQFAPTDLAYVIYTSGSTGRPKGVAIRHRNLCPLFHWGYETLNFSSSDRVIQNLAYYFDWSVWEIFITLTSGASLHLIDEDILLDARALAEFIESRGITVLHITPTQYQYLVRTGRKLMGLRYLLLGAEKLPVELVKECFDQVSEKCRVFNMYGPTEATIIATVLEIDRERIGAYRELSSMPIGRAVSNNQVLVLDAGNNLCPVGVKGELVIGGEGLSIGYLNNPELTAERFTRTPAAPQSSPITTHHSPITNRLYRTGDLCRWLDDGTIEFLGRIDFQVKIRGFRIELHEIETQLMRQVGIREAVVLARENKLGENFLCAYVVLAAGLEWSAASISQWQENLARELPDYMVPPQFVRLEQMPLNPNGKVDRRALPEPEMSVSGREFAAPRDEIESGLCRIWAEVLGMGDFRPGIDDDFFALGGHSLKATTLVYHIFREFKINLAISDVFTLTTIRMQARKIRGGEVSEYIEIPAIEEKEYYDISYAQRRLWVLCQFEEDSTAYNMPVAFIVSGPLAVPEFARAIQALSDRHESLRTVFVQVDGKPCQRVLRDFSCDLPVTDLRELEEETKGRRAREIYLGDANRAFDLERGPLFRFQVVRLADEQYLVTGNIHHIVNDGWSQGIITNDLIILYNHFLKGGTNPLPPLTLQYKDYTVWHNRQIGGESYNESRQYWLEKFKDRPNGLDLPLGSVRQPIQTFNGGRVAFVIDEERTAKLYRLILSQEATLFMGLLNLLDIFLYRYTGQQDIIIGAPIAARKRPELQQIVGFLVNTLVYRNHVNPERSFVDLLKSVKEEALNGFQYQDYPFDLLIEELGLDRDMSQSPLFNVMLAHNNAETRQQELNLEGVEVSGYRHSGEFNMSKFDLIFFMDESAGQVQVRIEYNSDLFLRPFIERMAGNFLRLLDDVLERGSAPVYSLEYISAEEYRQIKDEFNRTDTPFPPLTLPELFEAQVEMTPDKIAVKGIGEGTGIDHAPTITYRELNRQANRLAHYLRETHGVKPNDVIGVSMDRSLDMILVLLGIIKAGAAYLALDPTYPRERVLHILANSRSDILIIDRMRPELFGGYLGKILNIEEHRQGIDRCPDKNPVVVNKPLDTLYVNYTSGSTGTPNGAMLSHDCLTNLIQWQKEKTGIDCGLRVLQFTSINFCVSFQEIMGALISGGELHLIGDIERQDIDYLMDFLSARQIDILFLPFSYLNFLFNETGRWQREFRHSLKHIITAGEQLKVTAGLKRFLDLNPHIRLHNHYGSTEMHVVTSYTLDASTAAQTPIPPAGKPIDNVRIFILDDYQKPVAIGVWGELYVAGKSEILGYINNKELTEKKLLPVAGLSGMKLYRSGDVGRWQADGNIELRGRKDFQVKIRGFRVEPGEVESKLLAIEGVKEAVVVIKEDKRSQKYLAGYVVLEGIEIGEVRQILVERLPQYMVPHIVTLPHLPLMPNGKVDREKLPEPAVEIFEDYVGPETQVEQVLQEIWAEVLGLEKGRISVTANFFELGGHSLKATKVVSRVHQALAVKVPLVQVFKMPVIRELAGFIGAAKKDKLLSIEPVEKKEHYPLSSVQRRLYALYQRQPGSTRYNMPVILEMTGEIDKERLESTFDRLLSRHESLRTSFHRLAGEVVQRIYEQVAFELEVFRSDGRGGRGGHSGQEPIEAIVQGFVRPFDLSTPPLIRVGLIKNGEEEHILMVDMHHIVSDGTSMGLLVEEFMKVYGREKLEPMAIQYKDYVVWEQHKAGAGLLKKAETYWLKQFSGEIPVLDLPLDYERQEERSYAGGIFRCEIDGEAYAGLRKMCLEEGATMFMLLYAMYTILLWKLSLQTDIVVGVPIAGRGHVELAGVVGMFVNTLALRSRPGAGKGFRQYLAEVKENVLSAFDHQEFDLEGLVEQIGKKLNWKEGRNPLFDVMFTMQNVEIPELKIPGLSLKGYGQRKPLAKFDLSLTGIELKDRVELGFVYSDDLFKPETIERFAGYYREITASVLKNPDIEPGDMQVSPDYLDVKAKIAQEVYGEFEL